MKLRPTFLLSAVLLAAAPAANADRHPFGNGELPEILKPFDADNNGRLDIAERQAFRDAVREFREGAGPRPGRIWDTNGDGVLSPEEKAAAQEAIRARILEQRAKRFDELDKDDDGSLTPVELGGIPGLTPERAGRIFDHLDKNDDGKVTKEEFLAALRPPGDRPPPPPPPPPGDGDPAGR